MLIGNAAFSTESDLLFIEFTNGDLTYLAMVDSGAQINVMSDTIAKFCEKSKVVTIPISELSGFNGVKTEVHEWLDMPILLTNGFSTKIRFAIIRSKSPTIIFGIPFLKGVKAKIDFVNNLMETPKGPIMLFHVKRPAPLSNNTVLKTFPENIPTLALTSEQREQFLNVIKNFTQLWENDHRGEVKGMEHSIVLTKDQPIVSRPRTYCREHAEALDKEIKKMLADKVIQPSGSPYSSEVVMVKKKNKDWRMCIDYRKLNEFTIPDRYPLPRIPELLRSVADSQYFVALDLRSGYWQIPMQKESVKYTAFRTPQGLFEFCVMPFGLKNAPATFQRAMDFLFNDLRFQGVSVYLDDILIHGDTFEACLSRLQVVLARLASAGLTINMDKCNFFPKELEYLGHVLKDKKMFPNPQRVRLLQCIRPAKNITELRSILGMFGYYQTFVKNFSEKVFPLTDALKGVGKGKTPLNWTTAMQQAVEEISKELQTAFLEIPLENDEFLLETDASGKSVAGILSTKRNGKWVPVEFTSKKLGDTQQRWPVREKEAFAIVHSLSKFDQFLRTRPFTVHTDHQSLKWLLSATNGKIARWASRMAEYEMTVLWKKGKEIQHVDFFSRQVDEDYDLQPRMINTVTLNPTALPTIEDIINGQEKEDRPTDRGYFTRGKITYYRNGVWVPQQFRADIIASCHVLPPFCHSGVKKTKSTILRVFNWPRLHEEVTKYVRGCLTCQRNRPGIERIQGMMKTHPVPRPFDVVYMDIWHCRFNNQPHSVLTLMDLSTRWAEAEPIEAHSADIIAKTFLRVWVCRFGVPKVLVTDNEQGFASNILRRLTATLGISQLRSTPYHPQGNAPVETFHRILNQRLPYFDKGYTSNTDLSEALQLVLWSYRVTLHSTTRETPAFLVYGMDTRPPFNQDWRFASSVAEKDRIKFLNIMREEIQHQAYQRRLQENMRSNKDRLETDIREGQLILARSTPGEIQTVSLTEEKAVKFIPKWSLPCRVLKVYPGKQKFAVKNILSGATRDIHITDVRLIEPPQDERQRAIWYYEIAPTLESMFKPSERQKRLLQFWEDVDYPQRKKVQT